MIDCSVIIPHYNQIGDLLACIRALSKLRIKDISYEIIVVDNNSNVDIKNILEGKKIKLFILQKPRNPYACRNLGISKAKGNLLCFLDAKCLPHPDWMQNSYNFIHDEKCDIVGGKFEVESTSKLSSKIFPLMYLNVAKNVKYAYGLNCGNLFVKKEIFEKVGLFKTKSLSGNDISWTRKAQAMGYRIAYCEKSSVRYPAKSYTQLLKDIKKYGKGAVLSGQKSWYSIPAFLMPMKISTLNESLSYRNMEFTLIEKLKAWFLIWLAKLHFAHGMMMGLLEKPYVKKHIDTK